MSFSSFATEIADRIRSLATPAGQKRRVVLVAFVFAFALVVIFAVTLYRQRAEYLYDTVLLTALWTSYKQHSWDSASGRAFDAQNGNVTTSEGQAYTLLRAVWSDDRQAFDLTWRWTQAHLQRPDELFSWRYGRLPSGGLGILRAHGGYNTASDADVDIATALLLAGAHWHSAAYRAAAGHIIPAIWEHEVVLARERWYLAADDVEKTAATRSFVVNPSYAAPYAYRLFASVDHSHDWMQLADDSYVMLHAAGAATFGRGTTSSLPPDWVLIDRQSGAVSAPSAPGQTTDFGYDAFRALWRIGLDWQWFHTAAAEQLFATYELLVSQWQQHQRLAAVYRHNGQPGVDYESLALYGGSLGYFAAVNRGAGDEIIAAKLRPLYNQASHALLRPLSYYDNNWVWFGLALYDGVLPNYFSAGGAP